jgi:glycosyltransferase involved in cell wall biosynthesis
MVKDMSAKKNYPKILIVGQYFNTGSGGGITMTNLFKEWDKENIAVAAQDIYNLNFEVCDKYYQLGSHEIKRRFPFNLNRWGKPIKSGLLNAPKISGASSHTTNEAKKSVQKNVYLGLLHFTGLYHYKSRYKISNEFLKWVKEYSPDIIYSQLSTIELIDFVQELRQILKLPVAIHIMDDWPLTISKKGLFQTYWKKNIDKKFRSLLKDSKVFLSISEAMSEEYYNRYGYNFIPFHNPIDLKFWGLFSKSDYDFEGNFKILYAGRIGPGIKNCFFDMAEAIKSLIAKGLKIEFIIQSTSIDPILDELAKFDFIKLNASVPYNELPKIFSGADLLLLPNDFDSKSVSFLRYSMPTKASEYMISSTPILLYSSIETAITSHALKYNWAYVVSEKNKKLLETSIEELYNNKELRSKLGTVAREYAINNYNSVMIREQFRKSLT